MIDHLDFVERCCDGDDTLDIRLTKRLISERRAELRSDHRVALRPRSSDWIDITISNDSDRSFAERIVQQAIEANRPAATAGPPPTGTELDRRRRFH